MDKNKDLKQKAERLTEVFNYLVLQKKIKYKKDFAKLVDRDASNISQAISGNPAYLTVDLLELLAGKMESMYHDFDRDWLLFGTGTMFKPNYEIQKHHNPPYREAISDAEIILYDIDAAANLTTMLDNKTQNIIGVLKIPNLPNCDGAIYVRGDSMYPLLKSGDIAIYKRIYDFNNVVFGEMYIVEYALNGDIYLVVKYVNRSNKSGCVKLVSYNTHHDPMDIQVNSIRAMAIVKASVRLNTMI